MKKSVQIIAIGAFAVFIGIAGFNQNKKEELTRYDASFLDVFDTQTQIIGYGTSKEDFSKQIELIKAELERYNDLYDIYNDYEGLNNIKTINDNAGIQPVEVDQEIIDLLKLSVEMDKKTDGMVNVAFGSVLTIWHEYREVGINDPASAKLPPMEELEAANGHTSIDDIIIDEEASTVYLKDPEMSLDVGSIGKGYAVQKVADYAREELGIQNMLISVGGNVCAIGEHLDGTPWRLGIQNPDLESEEVYIKKVDVADACVVTSGNYQRYYTVDGVRYCHIIEPDSLMPANYFSSVSIITDDSGIADALSTTLYNMDFEDGLSFVENYEGVEAMWVFEDGTVEYSSGFSAYLVEE